MAAFTDRAWNPIDSIIPFKAECCIFQAPPRQAEC
jgi:hypothetical protein